MRKENRKTEKKSLKAEEARGRKPGAFKGQADGNGTNRGSLNRQKGQEMQKREKTPPLGEWLYLAPEETTVRSIGSVLGEAYQQELWEEAGVLEVGFTDGKTMDFEAAEVHPKDEAIKEFLKQHQCGKVFLVTFAPEAYGEAEKIMRCVLDAAGGLFCGDTEDFTPVIQRRC